MPHLEAIDTEGANVRPPILQAEASAESVSLTFAKGLDDSFDRTDDTVTGEHINFLEMT